MTHQISDQGGPTAFLPVGHLLAPAESALNASAVTGPTSLIGDVPVMSSLETDEIAEAHHWEDYAQLEDSLNTRIDGGDQGSNDHPLPLDNPDNNPEVIYISDDSLDDERGVYGQVSFIDLSPNVAERTEDVDPG
ncbi:hypothetical protein CEP54_015430 [Fusarium duplospermum]|uniref:Uncharacterized protein n=1 Tax=Fusarium duplospermum TaxID=1325734 RepID=A0A428NPA9_9HYPO|nr:hypothetical protein CEP54_015430 [Fusarium duplospermum]